jgi:ABC-type sugar transport system ATPase subunit
MAICQGAQALNSRQRDATHSVAMVDPAISPVLAVRGLSKSYGDARVLDSVDLEVAPGEVHALLGENGAGKSTLIKIVSGVVTPDEGSVKIDGQALPFGSPQAAMEVGVATLFQELATVGGLSVAENVLLGRPTPSRFGVVRWGELNDRVRALFEMLGQDIDVTQDADALSPVGKTMTALARALSQESKLLILDEPTAALTDAETSRLFAAIERLKAGGIAILYVSHRLEEVFDVAGRFTVLRNGHKVDEGALHETSVEGVIASMAGRPIEAVFPPWEATPGDVRLQATSVGGRRVQDATFDLRAGEVLGVAGLAGSGRSELLRLLAGATAKRAGQLTLDGSAYTPSSVGHAQALGVALVPPERRSQALIPDSVERNLNTTTVDDHAAARFVVLPRRERQHAQRLWDDIDVRARSLEQDVLTLSGGNQQKVVLARFLALAPRVLLLDEPTRGVDMTTKTQIYGLIRELAAKRTAVLMVSSELIELIGLCDRILVLHEGRIAGHFERGEATEEELLHVCYGRVA